MSVLSKPAAPTHSLRGATFTSLATPARGTKSTSVWSVELAPAHPATPHQVTQEEIFIVTSGRASVRIAGEQYFANAGDAIVVPANTNFEISALGTKPLRAICCLPVGGQARLTSGSAFVPPWAL